MAYNSPIYATDFFNNCKSHTMKSKTKMLKTVIIAFAHALLVTALFWVFISSFIQRFKCPQMTETQLFLHIPHSFVCDWKRCD